MPEGHTTTSVSGLWSDDEMYVSFPVQNCSSPYRTNVPNTSRRKDGIPFKRNPLALPFARALQIERVNRFHFRLVEREIKDVQIFM